MMRTARVRALLVGGTLAVVFTVFSGRLVYLQINQGEAFTAIANQTQILKQVIPAQRGAIRDAHGETLASDMPLRRVVVDGSHLKTEPRKQIVNGEEVLVDPRRQMADLLAKNLGLSANDLLKKLTPNRRYLVVKHQVPVQNADDLKKQANDLKLSGLYLEPDSTRVYPNNSLLCHVVGFTDFGGAGIQGVEKSMNRYLEGHPGYRYITRNRAGQELVQYRGLEQAAHDGNNVNLTIDIGLQNIVERELDAAVKKYTPENATAIFMRPKTGEIVAMASRPYFDLNARFSAAPDQMKNRAIIDMIEPGSTFKIVTLSGVLNEKLVRPDTTVYCENGRWEYAGKLLHDAHPIGECTVHDVLVHSSNIGAAKLALQLGEPRLYNYIKLLGFGERTGIDLPGEINGRVAPTKNWTKISITRIPMGQGVGVTPIQMVMAMGAIANGGKLMRPQIVRSITDDKDVPVAEFPPEVLRQAVNPETVRQVIPALEDVVSPRGTAKGAAVPGYDVGGKTGTAQKVAPTGGYMSGRYVVSFVGFLPANNPELVGMVMLDDAHTKPNENYGGLVAAPVFASIAGQAMRYLNIEPTRPIPPAGAKPKAVVVQNGHD